MKLPDGLGHFGPYGGQFVPEVLMPALTALKMAYAEACADNAFWSELGGLLRHFVGRPTPLYYAHRLTVHCGGAKIFLKREDLAHTGAHKINNAVGQALLVKKMGKKRVVAETGAGQHGVAAATVCALLGFDCIVYMGAEDIKRQSSNVFRMKLLGAEVRPVTAGSQTLKEAVSEAIRDWITNISDTYYLLGSAVGPHPYPMIVRDFQSVIGRETRDQMLAETTKLPDYIVACVGGGSNAIGIFHPFLNDKGVKLIGVEAAAKGLGKGLHSATLAEGKVGILHGSKSYLLQDEYGQIKETTSIAAGLDYPGVGPEHAYLKDKGRATYTTATDDQALEAFRLLCQMEGIIPALESAHAVYYATQLARTLSPEQTIVVNLSGRGDKDLGTVSKVMGIQL